MPAEITTRHRYGADDTAFDYTLIRRTRQKHLYIRIRNTEVIVSTSLQMSQARIEAILAQKAEWIMQKLHDTNAQQTLDWTHPNATLYWRGKAHRIVWSVGDSPRLELRDGLAIFFAPSEPSHTERVALFREHLRHWAPSILLPRVKHWSQVTGLTPAHVGFRLARTRWGSCSDRNHLSLNRYLLILPDRLIDYVIVHELIHIRHKNHSKRFWEHVAQFTPDWKEDRKALRTFESCLMRE